MHHLDRTTGQTKGHRPHRTGASPIDNRIHGSGDKSAFKQSAGTLTGRGVTLARVIFQAVTQGLFGGNRATHISLPISLPMLSMESRRAFILVFALKIIPNPRRLSSIRK
jgi:hypothetical protein